MRELSELNGNIAQSCEGIIPELCVGSLDTSLRNGSLLKCFFFICFIFIDTVTQFLLIAQKLFAAVKSLVGLSTRKIHAKSKVVYISNNNTINLFISNISDCTYYWYCITLCDMISKVITLFHYLITFLILL